MANMINGIVWIDVETTGLGQGAKIIEIAAVVTDRRGRAVDRGVMVSVISLEQGEYDQIVEPMAAVMHMKSGLVADLASGEPIADVEAAIIKMLIEAGHRQGEAWLVGGRGMALDMRLIKAQMPELSVALGYRTIDVLTLERAMRAAIGEEIGPRTESKHRALDDAFRAIETYKDWIKATNR